MLGGFDPIRVPARVTGLFRGEVSTLPCACLSVLTVFNSTLSNLEHYSPLSPHQKINQHT